MATMVIGLIKSVFGRDVSVDNGRQFEPRFLTYMANKLCQTFV